MPQLILDATLIRYVLGFSVVVIAAWQLGRAARRLGLPLITGYLFTGVLAGPSVLHLIPSGAVEGLFFIDEMSLAFIAFAAGSELYLKELRDQLRSIGFVIAGLVVVTLAVGTLTFYLLSGFLPFTRDLPAVSRLAAGLLAGAILVARSPSSAIAIINELRASGPFTRTVLGVTVIMDVVVIVLFAVNSSIADALLSGLEFDYSFLGLVTLELALAVAAGIGLRYVLQGVLATRLTRPLKIGLMLLSGLAVFELSAALRHTSHEHLWAEIFVEPLLVCVIGSFLLTNFSRYKTEWLHILHEVGPYVFVAFFTLTGASLALEVIASAWRITLALFVARAAAVFAGSSLGGLLAGEPMRHNRLFGMCFITQAGVALGLAKEVAVVFPAWGNDFAAILISVIVLNELAGPPFFKWAITRVGEAHPRAVPGQFDGVRDALIFGLDGQSLALAHQLRSHGWQVRIAASEDDVPDREPEVGVDVVSIDEIDGKALETLDAKRAEAIVAMLTDEENYRLAQLAYEELGTENIVVRLNDRANLTRFEALDVTVVDPSTAIVGLIDHIVRAPSTASLLLGQDEDNDVVDLEVRNRQLHGLALRELRLPRDTLVLALRRNGQMLITHGYTRLRTGDVLTVVGSNRSLERLRLRIENSG